MNPYKILVGGWILITLCAWSAPAAEKPLGVLLQEGIYQEETAKNLDKAMEIYRQILAETKKSENVAAQATYQLGLCHLKKDEKSKAAKYFQQLVTNYPKQEGLVSKANQQLEKLRSPQEVVEQAVKTISTCTESDPRVAQALTSLHGLKEEVAVAELAKYLDSSTDTVRRSAVFILWKGEFKNIRPAVPKLQELCLHQEEFTRGMSAIALGAAKNDASYETLCTMTLKDGSGYARRCAAYALGLLGRMEAKPILEKALNDDDPLVINNAKTALKMLSESPNSGPANPSANDSVPQIVKTTPEAFDDQVSTFLKEITVTFDRKMRDGSWSWTGGGETYPKTTGKPHYDALKTTCTLPVQLEPGKVYWVGVNAKSFKNFKTPQGIPAPWYIILFATKDQNGNPTPIPEDMLEQAKRINAEAQKVAEDPVSPAVQAAQEWLALVDGGQYEKSWDEAAKFFQKAITKDQWNQSLTAVRKPLGAMKERKVLSSTFTTQVPGAPDGKYVVIQFQSSFENKASAVETVTPMLDSDNAWRVSGYYIK